MLRCNVGMVYRRVVGITMLHLVNVSHTNQDVNKKTKPLHPQRISSRMTDMGHPLQNNSSQHQVQAEHPVFSSVSA